MAQSATSILLGFINFLKMLLSNTFKKFIGFGFSAKPFLLC
jgi:hypothetical protein